MCRISENDCRHTILIVALTKQTHPWRYHHPRAPLRRHRHPKRGHQWRLPTSPYPWTSSFSPSFPSSCPWISCPSFPVNVSKILKQVRDEWFNYTEIKDDDNDIPSSSLSLRHCHPYPSSCPSSYLSFHSSWPPALPSYPAPK